MQGPFTVTPGPPLSGGFTPPGDKSITHRAYLFALLADGETAVERPNVGADCECALHCVSQLGGGVKRADGATRIVGRAGRLVKPASTLDCGNSGTALRLLAGVLAGQTFRSELDGDDSLRRRPVRRIVEPLRRLGATLAARDGDTLPPLVVEGGGLRGAHIDVPVASAQVATCILLAGVQAEGRTSVALPRAARDHTERMLPAFGVSIECEALNNGGVRLQVDGPALLHAAAVRVPGDFSAAAFYLAAAGATPGACVTAHDVGLNPTRTALLDVMENMGIGVKRQVTEESAGEPLGDVTVIGPENVQPFDVPQEWVPRLIDEVPAWVLLASAARGRSTLRGASELRVKESDRIAALVEGLRRLGVEVEAFHDGLAVTGGTPTGGRVASCGDHRIAMAMALLGLRASAPVRVDDASSIGTSFPEFDDVLHALGGRTE